MGSVIGMIQNKQASKKLTQTYKHNPNFKIQFPGPEGYHFPAGPSHNSPCMDPYWRSQPIRQGKAREEPDFDLKPDEEDL